MYIKHIFIVKYCFPNESQTYIEGYLLFLKFTSAHQHIRECHIPILASDLRVMISK